MRVTFDITRDGIPAIDAATSAMAEAQQEVATGKRMQTVADDPSAASRAVGEHTELGLIDSYTATASAVSGRQSAVDSTLSDLINQLTAALSQGTGAQGSTATQQVRDAAADALTGIRDSVATDINSTYQGKSLFSGSSVAKTAYALVGGVWTYQGDSNVVKVAVNAGQQVAETWNGQAILQGSASTDVLTTLDNLATAVRAGDQTGISQGLTDLQAAFSRATQAQNALGADENSVSDATARLATLRIATDARRSKDEDTNMADAISRMNQAETAYRAALGAVARTGQLSLFDFMR
jgi:flagellar hook-associated protein 3 FlgL